VIGDPATTAHPLGHRVLRLRDGAGNVRTAISVVGGVPTLTMTGPPLQLASAVRAFDSDQIALGASGETVGLTADPVQPGLTESFTQLGSGTPIRLAGYGQSSVYVGVYQAQFGGPISAAAVHLVGTASPIPAGAQARLSAYRDGYLLAATAIRQGTAQPVALTFSVPSSQMQRDNGLTIRFDASPDRGDWMSLVAASACRPTGLSSPYSPVRLVQPEASQHRARPDRAQLRPPPVSAEMSVRPPSDTHQ
jgi:hypothetical protein